MRKLDFCICENKDVDQLHGNGEADQRFCFRNIDSLAILCGCTARFVSCLVGNPEDRFSQNEAHIDLYIRLACQLVYFTPFSTAYLKKKIFALNIFLTFFAPNLFI